MGKCKCIKDFYLNTVEPCDSCTYQYVNYKDVYLIYVYTQPFESSVNYDCYNEPITIIKSTNENEKDAIVKYFSEKGYVCRVEKLSYAEPLTTY